MKPAACDLDETPGRRMRARDAPSVPRGERGEPAEEGGGKCEEMMIMRVTPNTGDI
jgi:hypothetical protein